MRVNRELIVLIENKPAMVNTEGRTSKEDKKNKFQRHSYEGAELGEEAGGVGVAGALEVDTGYCPELGWRD